MAGLGKAIGDRLRFILEDKGMTVPQFMSKIQERPVKGAKSSSSVHNYLHGRKLGKKRNWPEPPVEFILEAARVLDVSVEWLLSGRESSSQFLTNHARQIAEIVRGSKEERAAAPAEEVEKRNARLVEFSLYVQPLFDEFNFRTPDVHRWWAHEFLAFAAMFAQHRPEIAAKEAADIVEKTFENALATFCELRGRAFPERANGEREWLFASLDFEMFASGYFRMCRTLLERGVLQGQSMELTDRFPLW